MEIPHTVYVPVTSAVEGCCTLRTCRRPDGSRTGVAFTSAAALERVVGERTPRITLGLRVLRAMLAEVGVDGVLVDPMLLIDPRPRASRAS